MRATSILLGIPNWWNDNLVYFCFLFLSVCLHVHIHWLDLDGEQSCCLRPVSKGSLRSSVVNMKYWLKEHFAVVLRQAVGVLEFVG